MSRAAGLNPLAVLLVVLAVDVVLLLSLDVPTAATALLIELLLLPLAGVPIRRLLPRVGALLVAALLLAVTVALYGTGGGRVYADFGLVHVSDGSLVLAAAMFLRLLAIALPAVVLFVDLDATRLADALAQRLHLPDRFVLGALAAIRLFEVLGDDWRTIALARRARGVGDAGRLRRLPGQAFALFVVALRRAVVLATAMEARGFGAPGRRTWARPSRFGPADLVLLVCGVVVAVGAVAVGLSAGTYRFVFITS